MKLSTCLLLELPSVISKLVLSLLDIRIGWKIPICYRRLCVLCRLRAVAHRITTRRVTTIRVRSQSLAISAIAFHRC